MILVPPLVGLAVATLVTRIMIVLAPKIGLVDLPNARSAHSDPTPTLGGLGIVAGFLSGLSVLVLVADISTHPVWTLSVSCGLLLVLIRDELHAMPWQVKLAAQSLLSILVTWGLGTEGLELSPVWISSFVIFVLFVYTLNAYNFMDGLDGLSGVEGLLVSGILSALYAPHDPFLSVLCLIVSSACFGFLLWNVPPARIFMGDVGAHFLGLFFVWVALVGRDSIPVSVALLPLGAFFFDTLYTLVRRAVRRERVTRAHRFHLYQRLERSGVTPLAVDFLYVFWTLLFGGAALAAGSEFWFVPATVTVALFSAAVAGVTEYRWSILPEAD
jgi:UDP-N-acetylmuramyl pentapeptide phosphotransferase/UDP-N-acetylglucosamine-1-phosphate transferase